jgi:HSP20 family molecular chaperone IbpA
VTRKNEEPFDEVFGDVLGEIHDIMGSVMGSLRQENGDQRNLGMHIDVQEIEGEIIVTVDLQGFEKEEIYIQSNGLILYIKAKNMSQEISEQIQLPGIINAEVAEAKYKNGILVIKGMKVGSTAEIKIE